MPKRSVREIGNTVNFFASGCLQFNIVTQIKHLNYLDAMYSISRKHANDLSVLCIFNFTLNWNTRRMSVDSIYLRNVSLEVIIELTVGFAVTQTALHCRWPLLIRTWSDGSKIHWVLHSNVIFGLTQERNACRSSLDAFKIHNEELSHGPGRNNPEQQRRSAGGNAEGMIDRWAGLFTLRFGCAQKLQGWLGINSLLFIFR